MSTAVRCLARRASPQRVVKLRLKLNPHVRGAPVDSGHFLTEENPEATAKLLREFFTEA